MKGYSHIFESYVNEMSWGELKRVEKDADKKLDPVDMEFTNHFFDRLNDPRNGKEITVEELTDFFTRLSKHKAKFKEVIKRYDDIVLKDKKSQINMALVNNFETAIAKTVMRKGNFRSHDHVMKFEAWENSNNIDGGLSDDKSVQDVADMHGIDIDEFKAKLDAGANVETEHTSDVDMAMEIALDHLVEDPNYYDKLKTIEDH